MSLRLRVVVAIAAVLLGGAAAAMALAGWQARRALHEELAAAVSGGARTVQSAFEDLPRSDHVPRDLAQLIATFDGNRHLVAVLEDPGGRILLSSRAAPAGPVPSWFAGLLATPAPGASIQTPVAGFGRVSLRASFAGDLAALWDEFLALSAVLAAAVAAGSLLVWMTLGRALRPLSQLSAVFRAIGSGDYRARAPEGGTPELARLGVGVNEMAARLAAVQARNLALEGQLRTLQDEERADLARDLHDELGPHLFAAGVDAATARRALVDDRTDEALARVGAIQAAVSRMQRLVRDILSRLRPTELIELGLAAAVGELVAFWRSRHSEIAFQLTLPSDEALIAEPVQETAYRVVQEALNNAVRHARAGAIAVEVAVTEGGGVTCKVADDGAAGGDPQEAIGKGFGLIGMRERVIAAGGHLDISRGPGGGWVVAARLPPIADATGARAA